MPNCKQCQSSFEVTEGDRAFYDKVSPVIGGKKYSIPEPTFCPACRQQRRYTIRNERHLYHRSCDLCRKKIVSMYSTDKPFPVYCPECWWGGKWEATAHSRDFDFSRPFFDQFKELQNVVPRIALYIVKSENCSYCNFVGDCKNSYLIYGSVYSEDCIYGSPYYSKNCLDSLVIRDCEFCYECTDCRKLYKSFYCQDCYDSDHLLFCYDLHGCTECIACAGLRHKKYHIENKPYSKEEYEAIKKQIDYCNHKQMQALGKKLDEMKLQVPHHYMPNSNAENVSGTHIYNCKNTFSSFYVDRCEDCSYCMQVVDLKDCYDNNYTEENELCYEYLGMYGTKTTSFSTFSRHAYNTLYSEYSINSNNLFGCAGVHKKENCILNKPHSKEEYDKLFPKIIEHMKTTGEWGEFFPITHAPFAYNETVAQEYFPVSESEAKKRGWNWKDLENQNSYKGPEYKVPAEIKDVPDDICKQILRCETTGRLYKVIPQELKFYREHGLPIPHRSPDQRHQDRMALRNPRKLYDRECDNCGKAIRTTYAPDRPEKVYCENCYLKTIY